MQKCFWEKMVQIDLLNSELPQIFNLLKKNAISAKHSIVKGSKKSMPVVNYSSMICWIICALLTYQKHYTILAQPLKVLFLLWSSDISFSFYIILILFSLLQFVLLVLYYHRNSFKFFILNNLNLHFYLENAGYIVQVKQYRLA